MLSTVPDFVFVFFTILFALQVYQTTGIRLISLSPTKPTLSIWVPVLMLSVTPTIYLIRMMALKYEELLTEDYVRTALAKGLPKGYIDLHHLYRNLKPFLFADLKKVISLTIGSLFVVEFLYNINGLTKFIFVDYKRVGWFNWTGTSVSILGGEIHASYSVMFFVVCNRIVSYIRKRDTNTFSSNIYENPLVLNE